MKKLLPILLLFFYSFASAQNYECVHRGQKTFFTNEAGYLRGIRFDSVVVSGTDTIYYPYKTKRYPVATTDSSNGSWVGSKIIQQSDGTFLFNTFFKDTVVIKTQAILGESWILHNDHTPDRYVATVESIDTMSFLGTFDTVKTIKITSYNGPTSLNPSDPRNFYKIRISKNHGFVSVFDLYFFPYDKAVNPVITGTWSDKYLYHLIFGFVYPENQLMFNISDFRSPTEMDITNYQVGDIFLRNKRYFSNTTPESNSDYTIDSVIAVTPDGPYRIKYRISYRSISYGHNLGGFATGPLGSFSEYDVYADTSMVMNIKGVPEELHNSDTVYYYRPFDTSLCTTSPYYNVQRTWGFEMCDYSYTYKKGFGTLSYETFTIGGISCGSTTTFNTPYAVKSATPCGIRYWPTTVENINYTIPTITISPNPASDIINISSSEVIQTLSLYDIMGRVVSHSSYNSKDVTLPIAMLSSGIYILKINNTLTRKIEVIK